MKTVLFCIFLQVMQCFCCWRLFERVRVTGEEVSEPIAEPTDMTPISKGSIAGTPDAPPMLCVPADHGMACTLTAALPRGVAHPWLPFAREPLRLLGCGPPHDPHVVFNFLAELRNIQDGHSQV